MIRRILSYFDNRDESRKKLTTTRRVGRIDIAPTLRHPYLDNTRRTRLAGINILPGIATPARSSNGHTATQPSAHNNNPATDPSIIQEQSPTTAADSATSSSSASNSNIPTTPTTTKTTTASSSTGRIRKTTKIFPGPIKTSSITAAYSRNLINTWERDFLEKYSETTILTTKESHKIDEIQNKMLIGKNSLKFNKREFHPYNSSPNTNSICRHPSYHEHYQQK